MSQKYLFRGTNSEAFAKERDFLRRLEALGRSVREDGDLEYKTSAATSILTAMIYSQYRRGAESPNAKPLLLAININNYRIEKGVEDDEYVILGKLNSEDIEVIDNLEKLKKVYPYSIKQTLDKALQDQKFDKISNYFKQFILVNV